MPLLDDFINGPTVCSAANSWTTDRPFDPGCPVGGTGMFKGATGHGRMNGIGDFHEILMHLRGSLHLDT